MLALFSLWKSIFAERKAMAKKAKCYSGIGGQAVLEGVMMKNGEKYAVAVRKPNGEITVELDNYTTAVGDQKWTKLPFIRGVFNFVDSMILGTKTLNFSASFYDEDEETPKSAFETTLDKITKGRAEAVLSAAVTVIALVLAVGIFMVLPYVISAFLAEIFTNHVLLTILEGVIRIVIFLLYVWAISLMQDIKRLYQYHGAEHKCINCIEKGHKLTVENVLRSSRFHKRCGTSFIFFVLIVSIVLFFFIRVDSVLLKVCLRLLLLPVVAGISYELIRLAGTHDNFFVRFLSAPGMLVQRLTTKEPDAEMVEVAIASVEAVFDWKKYIADTFGYDMGENP